MDRTEKLKMLNNLFTINNEIDAVVDAMRSTHNPDPSCGLYNAVFGALDVAIKATAAAIGDDEEWVWWMVHENECGHRGHEAGYTNALKPIRTAEDILDLIEEGNRANSEQ